MSNAIKAKGTLLQVETSEGSGVFVTIPEVKDINGPNLTSGEYDATTHDTAGLFKEFKGGLIDPGEVSGSINYVPGNTYHNQMASDKATLTERNYKLVYPNAKFWAFRAYTKTFNPKSGPDALLTADFSLRLVQGPTFPA